MTTTILNTKIRKVENKIPKHAKYIPTPGFNKLTAENFAARLKKAHLVSKSHFDNKLTSFYRKITSMKTKYLEVQKKLNSLITKDYNFFLGRIYFSSNDGSQNTFLYQPILDTLKLKKDKGIDNVISCKLKGVHNSKLKLVYTAFLHSIKFSGHKMGIKLDKDHKTTQNKTAIT